MAHSARPVRRRDPRQVAPATCGGCELRWWSLIESHCCNCHRQFAGAAAFDAHRIDGHCVNPEVIVVTGRPVLVAWRRASGTVWAATDE